MTDRISHFLQLPRRHFIPCSHRTYGELDVLFGAKVPARKFASTSIDQFQAIEREVAAEDVEKSSVSDSKGEGEVDVIDAVPVVELAK